MMEAGLAFPMTGEGREGGRGMKAESSPYQAK